MDDIPPNDDYGFDEDGNEIKLKEVNIDDFDIEGVAKFQSFLTTGELTISCTTPEEKHNIINKLTERGRQFPHIIAVDNNTKCPEGKDVDISKFNTPQMIRIQGNANTVYLGSSRDEIYHLEINADDISKEIINTPELHPNTISLTGNTIHDIEFDNISPIKRGVSQWGDGIVEIFNKTDRPCTADINEMPHGYTRLHSACKLTKIPNRYSSNKITHFICGNDNCNKDIIQTIMDISEENLRAIEIRDGDIYPFEDLDSNIIKQRFDNWKKIKVYSVKQLRGLTPEQLSEYLRVHNSSEMQFPRPYDYGGEEDDDDIDLNTADIIDTLENTLRECAASEDYLDEYRRIAISKCKKILKFITPPSPEEIIEMLRKDDLLDPRDVYRLKTFSNVNHLRNFKENSPDYNSLPQNSKLYLDILIREMGSVSIDRDFEIVL